MEDYYGKYVIHRAAIEGKLKLKLIKHLQKQGFKLDNRDTEGQAPMLLAALNDHKIRKQRKVRGLPTYYRL